MPDQHQQMIEVSDPAHVDAARRAAVRLAERVRADEQWLGRITVVAQELARNLVLHAGGGTVLLTLDRHGLDLVAVDKGPGMANIAQCLSDSYSTAGTMGAGLGAIRRMSDAFDIYSQPGQGTLVHAHFDIESPSAAGLKVGAVSTPYPGETLCGDAWAVLGNRIMVCDGLGHGHAAHEASQRARSLFLDHDSSIPLPTLMERLHRALADTRGGAIAFAEIQPARGQVEFCGIGNIAGVLLAERSRSMVSANGTVGYKIGRVQTFTYPWDPATVLVMSSDGIGTKWDLNGYPGLLRRSPAIIAAQVHRDFRRLNDDATVVVVKGE
ncbi:SpoIIE family protein phosphatase [Stutzerimonas urumqiensis]|uniref:SpoIIE family protein phosphatase n=1 Tax=Stutzerimonas urumqiensis TaxID=638269 RepID=UPI003DA22CAD